MSVLTRDLLARLLSSECLSADGHMVRVRKSCSLTFVVQVGELGESVCGPDTLRYVAPHKNLESGASGAISHRLGVRVRCGRPSSDKERPNGLGTMNIKVLFALTAVLAVAAAERAGYNAGAYNPSLYNTGAYAGDYYNRGYYDRRGYGDQYYGRDGYYGGYAGGRYAAPYRSAYGYAPGYSSGYAAGYNRPYSGAYGGYSGYRGYGAYGSSAGHAGYPGYTDSRYGRSRYGGAYNPYGTYRSFLFDDRYNQYMYNRGYYGAPYGGAYGPYEQRTQHGYSYGYSSPNSQVYSSAGYRA
ncbi:hypothetical protein HPB52_007244 [Rhipicephalus sanguineus]|uniref:Uncharacterized protein n=1 Tax=Rhipicephalus sanguineus TaxID=34632 RepID=A0A9D4PR90_RHISA|nr:hypothetical protein HPB52_007244 [Rhipicephalus sanguineus]